MARNFLLSSELSYSRKIREMVLAMRIDSAFSKDKILELYLNEIFLGENSYGVAAAATVYFGKSLDELSLSQVAFLAGLPKAPSNYNPKTARGKEAAVIRRNYVIEQMEENGYVMHEQEQAAVENEHLVAYTRPASALWCPMSTISLRRSAASSTPNTARRRCMTAVCRCVRHLIRDCKKSRCASYVMVSLPTTGGMAIRGPLKHVDAKASWADRN